jgi:hypothetical protein
MSAFLQLPPEQGGTRFGPFTGPIRIGSQQGQCEITLATPGVAPLHVTIFPTGNGMFTVQPTTMNNLLFIYPPGQAGSPVNSAVQVTQGYAVAIGGPQGPRFTVQWEGAGAGAAAPSQGQRGGQGYAAQLGAVAKTQARFGLMRKFPMMRQLDMWLFRARSGSLMHPRYIIGALTSVAIVAGGAALACCGGLAAMLGLDVPMPR